MFQTLLFLHISVGTLGLLIGPVAMVTQKKVGWHTRIGQIYFWLMATVCLSAGIMAVMHWGTSSYLLYVGIFSFAFALRGYLAVKKRRPGWLKRHIGGMLGSYIAMVTALLVVNHQQIPGFNSLPPLWVWLLPTLIGSPIIGYVQYRQSRTTHQTRELK